MSVFNTEDLMKAMLGDQKNPLRTIGFSSELLRLGLSEDELWGFAKKVARDLTAILHPDANNSDEREAAVEITTAFQSLKDRNTFLRSLREFKHTYNEDRSNENLKKRSHDAQQTRVDELSRKLRKASEVNENLSREIGNLRGKLITKTGSDIVLLTNPKDMSRKPLQQIRMLRQARLAIAMFVHVATWQGVPESPERLEEILNKYQLDRKRALKQIANFNETHKSKRILGGVKGDLMSGHVEQAHHDLMKGGFASKVFQEMVQEANKQPIPTLNWDFNRCLQQYSIAKGGTYKRPVPDPTEVLQKSCFDFDTIKQVYKSQFEQVTNFLSPHLDRISEVYIHPEVIDLTGGMLNDNVVVGSAFLGDSNVDLGDNRAIFNLGSFPLDLSRRYLCEGGLVAVANPIKIGIVGQTSAERAAQVSVKLANKITSSNMYSSRILIEFL